MKIKLPKMGEKRTIEGFLFLPRGNGGNIRWLEYAKWMEEYVVGVGWVFSEFLD